MWQDVLANHPARGALVPAAQRAVDELQAFVVEKQLVTLPPSERVIVAAAPPFDALTLMRSLMGNEQGPQGVGPAHGTLPPAWFDAERALVFGPRNNTLDLVTRDGEFRRLLPRKED